MERILLIRHEMDGTILWEAYENASDDLWRDIQAALNTVGVERLEIIPG